MKIVTYNSVRKTIRKTARYIQKEFGAKSRLKFIDEVKHTMQLLVTNPELGSVELYLEGAPVRYRSIVVQRLNKIIYWINGDVIEIVDFWDCRRDPDALAKPLM